MPLVPPRLVALVVAAALPLASGCGEPDAVAVEGPLRLTISEYRVSPQVVRVPAGRVELVVRNAGTMVHQLQIRTLDRTRALATSPPLRPGETARLTVELPPGDYVSTCPLDRHDTLGEHGEIAAG
jgi:hypothetical protein